MFLRKVFFSTLSATSSCPTYPLAHVPSRAQPSCYPVNTFPPRNIRQAVPLSRSALQRQEAQPVPESVPLAGATSMAASDAAGNSMSPISDEGNICGAENAADTDCFNGADGGSDNTKVGARGEL